MIAQVRPGEEIGDLGIGAHRVFAGEEIVGVVGGEEGAEGFCEIMMGKVSAVPETGGMVVGFGRNNKGSGISCTGW